MATNQIEIRIAPTVDTSALKQSAEQIKKTLNDSLDANGVTKSTKDANSEISKMTSSLESLSRITGISAIAQNFQGVKKAVETAKQSVSKFGKELLRTFGLNDIKDWFGQITAGDYLESVRASMRRLTTAFKGMGAAALNVAKVAIPATIASMVALVALFNRASEASREFREAMNQVNTSFTALGSNAAMGQHAYEGFYRVLGQVDRSAEAANLLAQITTNQKDLTTWTQIATGALAMFPDSLPTEGLIEASNETIKTAKVVGVLADALNWPAGSANKISEALKGSAEAQGIFNKAIAEGMTVENAMNEVLAATNNTTQREVILRAALNGVYAESAGLYERVNADIIAQNEAQNRLNQALAKVGSITQSVTTAWTNFKATILEAVTPAIQTLCNWLVTAITWVSALISVLFPGTKAISTAVEGVSGSLDKATGGSSGLTEGLESATKAAEKLRRATMGFDELNIVSDLSSSGSSGNSGAADSGGAAGGGIDVSGIDTGESIFSKAKTQFEEFKEKISAFMEKWEPQIKAIGAALAALGIATLLSDLGKAIGLGDGFLATMKTIQKLAGTAITIVLQYSLVNEFMDKYIDGAGFKEYLKGLLVAALGTGVLYAMWGPAGLAIGLAVTAVASIKAVIDNGGITNIESAVVAFTGLATAVGAVYTALKVAGLGKIFGEIGAAIALIGEGNGILATLAAAFPKLSAVIKPVVSAVSGFVGGLTAGPILLVAGIIAAISAVVVFLKENWDAVTQAVKRFFDINIGPKLEAIKESFKKMGDALLGVWDAIKELGSALWNLIPEDLRQKIEDVVKAIGDWFASIEWLELIGKAFEVVGGIIFGVVSGVIAGALSMLASIFEGAVQAISGAVQVIAGLIEAIVKLFSGDLQGAWDACKKIFDGIVDIFVGLYDATIGAVIEFVKGVIDWFVALWDELVGHSIVPDMINAIVEWFGKLPTKILGPLKTFVENVIKTVKDMWSSIKSWFNTNVAPKFTQSYWQNKFDTIRSAAAAKIAAVKEAFSTGWGNVKAWFNSNVASVFTASYWSNKFSSIKDGARNAFNGVIDVIERAINHIIRKINSLSWTVPDWVPSIGGDRWGFNFKTISIPRLAEGGIATRSTLANIGENGREAVLPLDNYTSWMDKLAERIAGRNQTPSKIVLMVDGKQLGWAAINSINGITKQTGEVQLRLV